MTPKTESIDPRTLRSIFPDPRTAPEHGLVAIGGDYRPEMLLAAYASGIFPWPSEDLAYGWFSPDPRWVLRPAEVQISRSLRKTLRRGRFHVTFDQAFDRVIEHCCRAPRPGQEGTWITREMVDGYCQLHRLGWAHSVETWREDELVGGLYGVSLGGMFGGESMFYLQPDASKVALVTLVQQLDRWGFTLLDCQVQSDNLERFGAREIRRADFLDQLDQALELPTRRGLWSPSA